MISSPRRPPGRPLSVKVATLRSKYGLGEKIEPPPKEILEDLYLTQERTPSIIAYIFHVSTSTVRRWIFQYGIILKRPTFSKTRTGLTETQKAYLAGYLDGDGTITVNYSRNKNRPRWTGFQKDVSLVTRVRWFAEEMQRLIGGDLSTFLYHDSRYKKEGYKIGFTNQESALMFLREISPYLILKKRQAESMIAILEERLSLRALKGNSAPITPFTWEEAEKIRRWNNE